MIIQLFVPTHLFVFTNPEGIRCVNSKGLPANHIAIEKSTINAPAYRINVLICYPVSLARAPIVGFAASTSRAISHPMSFCSVMPAITQLPEFDSTY
jgi:hypothetical protein